MKHNNPSEPDDFGRVDEYIHLTSTSIAVGLGALTVLFLAFVTWMFFGKITDKAYLRGVVFPSQGTVDVQLPNKGLVRTMFVHKGDAVTEGQALALVSVEGSYSIVSAPTDGVVLSYIAEGETFEPFEGVVNLLAQGESARISTVIAFGDFKTSRNLKTGQRSQVTPSYDSRERIGYVEAKVGDIVPYPISRQEAGDFFENNSIVDEFFPDAGAVYMIEIDMETDESDPSGLKWSFDNKDLMDMSVGTYCDIEVEVRSRSLFNYLLENIREDENSVKLWLE